jgi:histone acetyltransferase (RNA polymerase elongator complex component)
MNKKHYNIPVFIPNAGCVNKCIFCDQNRISGVSELPSTDDIRNIIDRNISTIPEGSITEIAFFGGSFTGIPFEEQEKYLRIASGYFDGKKIRGIRLSTRPDYINPEIISLLKKYRVTAVELGIQSMDSEVLKISGRNYTAGQVNIASELIKQAGISLGVQMMIGLPGDTLHKAVKSAQEMISLEPETVRIYPTLVIRGTELEGLYNSGKYEPLSLKDAILWCADIFLLFEEKNIRIIKAGLHPNEGLITGEIMTAGPFHLSFRELVLSEIWRRKLEALYPADEYRELILRVNPAEFNYAVGYETSNKKMLLEKFRKVIFKNDAAISGRNYNAEYN